MLTAGEIRQFLEQDAASEKKQRARTGERYYEGDHDIRDYRLFFFDADGILREDHNRANTKIPHPFYAELVDQGVQYLMSSEQIAFSDDQTLQGILDDKINYNDLFRQALADAIEKLIDNAPLRLQMGRQAKADFDDHLTYEHFYSRIQQIYDHPL